MTLRAHAEYELNLIGMGSETTEPMNLAMRNHILHIIDEFSEEGHSGFSASYAIQTLEKLLAWKPLTPLTGEPDEWVDVSVYTPENGGKGYTLYQNKRQSNIFKQVYEDGSEEAYTLDGIVFWEWWTDPVTKERTKNYFTNRDSRVIIKFPYTSVDPIYKEANPDR